MSGVGLVTGSLPFAGLPDSPSDTLLSGLDGLEVGGITVRTLATPPRLDRLPVLLPEAIAAARPAFVLSLGLALGTPVLRLETTALNRLAFAIADDAGARPTDGGPVDPHGPAARFATWDTGPILAALLADGLPAVVSHFAGTHLCNGTLYRALGAMEAAGLAGPVGFLHLPYLPAQVARFLAEAPVGGDRAPVRPRELPSMAAPDQARALRIVLQHLATQAARKESP